MQPQHLMDAFSGRSVIAASLMNVLVPLRTSLILNTRRKISFAFGFQLFTTYRSPASGTKTQCEIWHVIARRHSFSSILDVRSMDVLRRVLVRAARRVRPPTIDPPVAYQSPSPRQLLDAQARRNGGARLADGPEDHGFLGLRGLG